MSALLTGGTAQAAAPYANASVQGALAPGVYGRIEIGNAPPPPLVYVQPVIIQRAPVFVEQQPLYLHVPPGHAKKWSKHCARYNACNRPVYFVKVRGDDDFERRKDKHRDYRDDRDGGHGEDHGNGKVKGNGKDHDKGHHGKAGRD
ncbi:MAG: hypothetical protein ABIR35_11155 [Polaromonas sp.]